MSTAEAAVDRSNGSVKAVTHNQVNKERKLKFTLSFTPEAARATSVRRACPRLRQS